MCFDIVDAELEPKSLLSLHTKYTIVCKPKPDGYRATNMHCVTSLGTNKLLFGAGTKLNIKISE